MWIGLPRRFDMEVRVRSLALKWFWPGLRPMIFPLRVTFRRLAYDLTVFLMLLNVFFAHYFFSMYIVNPFGPFTASDATL